MKKNSFLLLGILFATMILAACSSSTEPSELYKNESAHEIYLKGKSALQDKGYTEATKRFEALSVQYPFGEDTENADLFIIYAYYMKDEYTLAETSADTFIHTYPANSHVDYAYYMRGLSDYYQNLGFFERLFTVDLATRDLTQIQKSFVDFSELVTKYPNSYYAPAAYQYMIYLRNIIADHELQVGEYYYGRHAYVASANRAADVVMHYQGAPAIPSALALMAKSYRQLGMTKMEQDTLTVLHYNYPTMTVKGD